MSCFTSQFESHLNTSVWSILLGEVLLRAMALRGSVTISYHAFNFMHQLSIWWGVRGHPEIWLFGRIDRVPHYFLLVSKMFLYIIDRMTLKWTSYFTHYPFALGFSFITWCMHVHRSIFIILCPQQMAYQHVISCPYNCDLWLQR